MLSVSTPEGSAQPKICQGLWQKQSPKNSPSLLLKMHRKILSSPWCKFQLSPHLSHALLSATISELSCHQIWLMKDDSSIILIPPRKWKKVSHAFHIKHITHFRVSLHALASLLQETWLLSGALPRLEDAPVKQMEDFHLFLFFILCTHARLSMLVLSLADPVWWLIQYDSCLQRLQSNGPKPCLHGLKGVFVEDSP